MYSFICRQWHLWIVSFADSDSFASFLVWIPFLSFSSLIATARTSRTMLSSSGERGHRFLIPDRFYVQVYLPPALGLHCCVKFSLGAQSGDCSLAAVHGFLGQCPLLLQSTGSRTQGQWLWCRALVALWQMASSWTRDCTHVSYIGRQILYWWATRETPYLILKKMLSVLHHWEWCLLWACPIRALFCWGMFPLCLPSGELVS